ncbi:MAG TPA: transglutaminaseTgpA domain-containing protein [Solirubrobacteraceae bacterium]|nr:transglutaminaseTgpA domain-containing protein [Solirubrobacteraceae bacterium]
MSATRSLPSEPTMSLPVARGLAFFALAGFGALHWMVLLEPSAPERALYALTAAALVIGGLLAVARLQPRARRVAAAGVTLVALALAILGGGIADELLRPEEWGTLASGIARGIESLPGIRVPYRGVDEWTRSTIGVGGTALTVLAAAVAFWPRSGRTGYVIPALILLVALYAVPAVALDFENEFLRGAALALLVVAFLALERLRLGDAGNAGLVATAAAILALLLAPALDGDQPWWDYETWALGAASARSASFSWDHDYGPLDWPRDGRELLRVKAERWPAYWKAANLDSFDGIRWRQGGIGIRGVGTPGEGEEGPPEAGLQDVRVTIRNLTTRSYVTAGYATDVDSPTVRETDRGDGTWVAGRPLRRGDAYEAEVYTPQTNEGLRREAGNEFPRPDLASFRRLLLPASGRIGQSGAPRYTFDFPAFGFDEGEEVDVRAPDRSQPADPETARAALDDGPYARTWALAQRLRDGAETQEDLVQSVLEYLRQDDFGYTEQPPRAAYTLDGFLFDAKLGYCQQFSGAMALLLRMAGVPSRVVTGFTSGSLDSKTREYVVRDLDAHSWVEVWYAGIGWVTFDPTPAAAPPRAQPDEARSGGAGGPAGAPPSLGGDVPSDPGRRGLAAEGGTPWGWIAAGVAGGLALALAIALLWRARRRGPTTPAASALAELERALRRTRQQPGPSTTLRALEHRFAPRNPAAAGYVRALSQLRYGGRPLAPTPAQRRGLRAELARGNGLAGRLRAWWALPPRTR